MACVQWNFRPFGYVRPTMRMLRAGRNFLNNPVLSATGNLLLLITAGPIVFAAALAAVGWLAAEPFFFAVAVVLVILEGALVVG
jgi:hypothetical protein